MRPDDLDATIAEAGETEQARERDARESRSQCFAVVAVWPNGHGTRRWVTAAQLDQVCRYFERGGARVVPTYLGRADEPVTHDMPEDGYAWDDAPTFINVAKAISDLSARVEELEYRLSPQPEQVPQ